MDKKSKIIGQVFFSIIMLATSMLSFINFMRQQASVLWGVTFFITFIGGVTLLYIALVWSKRKNS